MPKYYYSTQPFLAWCFNHYFYKRTHWTFAADNFYPNPHNPPSSNPYVIYGNVYQEWHYRDAFGKYLQGLRLNLSKGVWAVARRGVITSDIELRLWAICDTIDPLFMYPVVYRIDIEMIPAPRRKISGSGTMGSQEVLIEDLQENEFDILFLDYADDVDFVTLANHSVDETTALSVLESRC